MLCVRVAVCMYEVAACDKAIMIQEDIYYSIQHLVIAKNKISMCIFISV